MCNRPLASVICPAYCAELSCFLPLWSFLPIQTVTLANKTLFKLYYDGLETCTWLIVADHCISCKNEWLLMNQPSVCYEAIERCWTTQSLQRRVDTRLLSKHVTQFLGCLSPSILLKLGSLLVSFFFFIQIRLQKVSSFEVLSSIEVYRQKWQEWRNWSRIGSTALSRTCLTNQLTLRMRVANPWKLSVRNFHVPWFVASTATSSWFPKAIVSYLVITL